MWRAWTVALIWWVLAGAVSAEAGQRVRVVVRVPEGVSAGEAVYLAGSLASVGGWKADGVRLARQADGSYAGEVELEAGQALEFKVTRGGWETVEKNADGSERGNRVVTVDAGTKVIEVVVDRWADDGRGGGGQRASTVVGELRLHRVESRALKQARTIRVWLPPGYEEGGTERYGVLYMHDGQNCFDRATSAFGNEWEIDEALTRLIAEKRVRPLIVVGIDNGQAARIGEYTYDADPGHGGGRGAAYAEFLLDEVRPLVERAYRTRAGREHTFIGGSSLGGLISLEIARRHPGVFGGVIAMSPAVWWAGESLTRAVERDPGGLAAARVWVDMGSREGGTLPAAEGGGGEERNGRFVASARRLDAALAKHKVDHRFVIDEVHAGHNEPAWARRFPDAIAYVVAGAPMSD